MQTRDERIILDYLYRARLGNNNYNFRDLIRNAIFHEITQDNIEADRLADIKLNSVWAELQRDYNHDLEENIIPLFDIVDNHSKTVKWIGVNAANVDDRRRYYYFERPDLYTFIDNLTWREFEALGCVLCKLLGANNIHLTTPGNEGGIDFIASINFSSTAHYLFGIKGPIRIIGQCKKYTTRDNVGHMKEFIQTLNAVYNVSYRPGEIIPRWFFTNRGPIIGWHISCEGHQSGALQYAKNFGIITSSKKDIIDLICKSKLYNGYQTKEELLQEEIRILLST